MAHKPSHHVGLVAFAIVLPILFILVIGSQSISQPAAACAPLVAVDGDGGSAGSDPELDAEQMEVATQIVGAVRAFPATANKPHAAVIALATARQESGIRNLDYGDRDSLGAFQQRPSQGWGTPEQVMNVPHATTSFLQRLALIPEWETRRVTDVAADVQRPAEEYRGLYEQWVPLGTRLTELLWPESAMSLTPSSTVCESTDPSVTGQVVYPVPPIFIGTDSHNWGGSGTNWASWHTGTDFSVPCGTAVLAATAGTVEIDRSQSWAGTWLVKVVTGADSVATWYAHMERLDVTAGQTVGAGDPLGDSGARGNVTGCHLHFEVHTRNGTIYGADNVDPSAWLAQHASTAGAAEGG